MLVESPEALRAWLTKEMAPICDAEPAALAKYVLALLRKDKPEAELIEFCAEQLDVFLQAKARPFVERLFGVIRAKSYLPTPPAPPQPATSSTQIVSSPNPSLNLNPRPRGGSSDSKKKDIDERKEVKERDSKEDDKKKLASKEDRDKDKDLRKGRDEKEPDNRRPQPEMNAGQTQRAVRKRISPPPAATRDEGRNDSRRDHTDARFDRRRSRSPRDRRSDRDRLDRGAERGLDRPDRGSDRPERGSDRPERGSDRSERGLDRPDRGLDRGSDRPERGLDRGSDRPERGLDRPERGLDRAERGSDRPERGLDRRVQVVAPPRAAHRVNERYKSERKRSRSPYERPRREKSAETDRKKKRCRDYDEKGYCMKGDQCMYDHGPDPVVVDDIALEKMVSTGAGGKAPTGPPPPPVGHMTPNFSVPPPGYTPLNPPPPGVDNVYVANSTAPATVAISEGYNPEAPALSTPSLAPGQPTVQGIDFSVPPPPLPVHMATPQTTYTVPSQSVLVHPPTVPYDPVRPSNHIIQQTLSTGAIVTRRGRGGGLGAMGGRFGAGAVPHNNRTLQVRKIPAEMNNITKLNEHFANFGQIVNIQVCFEGDPEAALITYSNRGEAMGAYKSTAPILNNRFIKVFWHAPDQVQMNQYSHAPNQMGSSSVNFNPLKGSLTKTVHVGGPPRVSSQSSQNIPLAVNTQQQEPVLDGSNPLPAPGEDIPLTQFPTVIDKQKMIELSRKRKQEKENKLRMFDLHRRKSALLSKEIEQQKLIIKTLQGAVGDDKKKQLYMLFKKVDESVKALKGEIEELSIKLLAMNKPASESGEKTAEQDTKSDGDENNGVDKARKRTRTNSGDVEEKKTDTTAPAKKSRHLDSTQAMDNRTTVVAVRGFKAEFENDLISHMEDYGELMDMDFTTGGRGKQVTAYFTYKTRRDAERAMKSGQDFSGCPITLEWAPKGAGGIEVDGVIPDEKRNPAERVTPAALLASLDESDDDGDA